MIHFVVHEPADGVGVVVVEGVKAGTDLIGWVMDGDLTLNIKSESDIPIGHKISLNDFKPGDTVMKYGVDIGKVVAPIKKGEHLHVIRALGLKSHRTLSGEVKQHQFAYDEVLHRTFQPQLTHQKLEP